MSIATKLRALRTRNADKNRTAEEAAEAKWHQDFVNKLVAYAAGQARADSRRGQLDATLISPGVIQSHNALRVPHEGSYYSNAPEVRDAWLADVARARVILAGPKYGFTITDGPDQLFYLSF